MVETGRKLIEEEVLSIKEKIIINDIVLRIELLERVCKIYDSEDSLINIFRYDGKITNSQIGQLATVLRDLNHYETIKDARSDLVGSGFLNKLNSLRDVFEIKKKSFIKRKEGGEDISLPWGEFNPIQASTSFLIKNPIFYDKSRIWWIWDKKKFKWFDADDIQILNSYRKYSKISNITKNKVKSEVINALQMVGREYQPKETKIKYIQFKDKVVNIEDGKIYPIQNRFFFTNPIPWEIGESDETPTLDKLFEEWVGEKYVKTLYEIIAYCCYRGYPIQVLFAFVGCGRNGKSVFQKVINKFIGADNNCSIEFDDIVGKFKNRFATFKMYRKLICQMGETNFGTMDNTSLLKKLTGGDLISYEKKRADPFDEYSYAKIIMNTNSLPSSADTSEGFYRRWVIIDFENQFEEGKDILSTIPDGEFNNLAKKVISILPEVLEKGMFTNQGSIEERKNKYIETSNPLAIFIDEFCTRDYSLFCRYSELYSAYAHYLSSSKKRIVTKKEFGEFLDSEGFEKHRTSKKTDKVNSQGYPLYETSWFIEGLGLVNGWKEKIMSFMSFIQKKETKVLTTEVKCHSLDKKHKSHNDIIGKEILEPPKSNIDILKECLNDLENITTPVPVDELIKSCRIYDIDELKVDDIIEGLKRKGELFEPKPGFIHSL